MGVIVTEPGRARPAPAPGWTAAAAACATGLAACITVLNLGARFVAGEGGFVARGGPYEIAHPAPDWIWLVPVSILAGFVFGGVHILAARRAAGFNILGFTWVGLFGSLGWTFFDFGFTPPWGGLVWAWILCGVVFWAMTVPVVLELIGRFVPGAERLRYFGSPIDAASGGPPPTGTWPYRLAHLAALPLGIALGILIYRAVAGG